MALQRSPLVGMTLTFRFPGGDGARHVEVLFAMPDLSTALEYKDGLMVDDTASADALALRHTDAAREAAYLGRSAVDVVVILGSAGAQAAAGVAFTVPVVIVDSAAEAAGAVICVFGTDAGATGAPEPAPVDDVAGFTLPAGALAPGARTSYTCRDHYDIDLVNRILMTVVT